MEAASMMQSIGMAVAQGGTSGFPHGSVLRITVENTVYPITLEALYQIFSTFGPVLRIIIFTRGNQFQALIQYADPMSAYQAKMTLDGHCIYPACCVIRIDFSRLNNLKVKYNNDKSRDFTRSDLPSGSEQPLPQHPSGNQNTFFPWYGGAPGYVPTFGFVQGIPAPSVDTVHTYPAVTMPALPRHMTVPSGTSVSSPVLLITNLNPEVSSIDGTIAITPYGLFILFGVYGDVLRVKILYKNKECALIQMADATQALIAMNYLNGQRIYGRILHATYSKYHVIALPREGGDAQGLTKDYSNSPLHRFKSFCPRNFQNFFPPSATLHLCNIPPSVTADELKKLFVNVGSTVKAFRSFQKHCNMALIQLSSVEEAVHALIKLHNYDLGENHHLFISFTNSKI